MGSLVIEKPVGEVERIYFEPRTNLSIDNDKDFESKQKTNNSTGNKGVF